MLGITVGLDGSHHSQQALEWAMNEAALKHAPLTVLTVHPAMASAWTRTPVVFSQDLPDTEQASKAAEEAVAKVASQLGDLQPPSVSVRAVHGFPAQELLNASKDSDLLVLGRRGGGGFGQLMMGSVASQVVHHSACPVVVVPTSE